MKDQIKKNISWINGQWGTSNQIKIPITDRGLTLGDGIFETILIYYGKPQLLRNHLNRWQKSAAILNMASPPGEKWLKELIEEAIKRAYLEKSHGALRLNWTRGDHQIRGVKIHKESNKASTHRFWLEVNPIEPSFTTISTLISRHETRNANSQYSRCKSFAYGQSIQASYEANASGYDDALLLSTSGELCCGTTANLIIKRKGEWITPRLACGCLPGIMREQGLNSGLIKEAKINSQPLEEDEYLLINSLSCKPIKKVNNQMLNVYTKPKELWLSLLRAQS